MLGIALYDVVLSAHVMAIVLAFGVTFAYPILFPYVERRHPESLAALHDAQGQLGKLLITPFATLALITGIYLAADRDLFGKLWVQVPLGILVVLLGVGGAFFTPTERRAAELCRSEPGGAAYRAVARRIAAVGALSSLLVLVAIFFMVAKPG